MGVDGVEKEKREGEEKDKVTIYDPATYETSKPSKTFSR